MTTGILVPFSVHPAAILDSSADTVDVGHHRRFIELWRDVGVLLVPGSELDRAEIKEVLQHLEEPHRTIWRKAFEGVAKQRMRVFADGQLGGRVSLQEIEVPGGCSKGARVYALAPRLVKSWSSKLPTDRQVTTIALADQVEAFSKAKRMACCTTPPGEDVEELWASRVAPVLTFAVRKVCIIDRYCAYGSERFRGRSSSFDRSGLFRLFKEFERVASDVECELFVGPSKDNPDPISTIRAVAEEAWGGNRPVRLQVFDAPVGVWEGVHYRGIIVDQTTFLHLDYGLEAFNGLKLKRTLLSSLQSPPKELYDDTQKLRGSCHAVSL